MKKLLNEDLLLDFGTERKQDIISRVEKFQHEIYNWYSNTMKITMEYCISVIGEPPRRYALVGMGSLARKEITPYSDFEHVIVLEEGVQSWRNYKHVVEYFRWLSVIFHITVVNLGETIVPSAALPYINNSWITKWNWLYDAYTKKGISFDGMFPSACKFPLGRPGKPGWSSSAELIKPISEMLKYISNKTELKNGYHLPDLLTSTCFVGNESIHKIFTHQTKKMGLNKEFIVNQLLDDLKNFNPIDNLSEIPAVRKWNIKRVVYRSTTLFVEALTKSFYSSISDSFAFQNIRNLARDEIIDDLFAQEILFALAVACYFRLTIYCNKDRQEDRLEIFEDDENIIRQFTQTADDETAISYFATAIKFQRETCKLLVCKDAHYVQCFPQADRLLACYWLRQFDQALWEANQISQEQSPTSTVSAIATEVVLNMAKLYFETEKFDFALTCFDQIYKHQIADDHKQNKTDVAYCLYFMGECSHKLQEYANAIQYFQQELKMITSENHSGIKSKTNGANYKGWIGWCFKKQGLYSEASTYFKEALSEIKFQTEQDAANQMLAFLYNNLGKCFFKMEKYNEALTQFEKTKTIPQKIGETTMIKEKASASYWINRCFNQLGQFPDPEECCVAAEPNRTRNSQQMSANNDVQSFYTNSVTSTFEK